MCSSGGRAPVGSKHNGMGQIYNTALMVRHCGPGGICVAVTGSPSQMQELSISEASLSLLCFSFSCYFFPHSLLPWSIFTWRERIHKLWGSHGARALAASAVRGRTEISFMWRYVVVRVSCGNKSQTVINNWNAFQIRSCYLRQPQKSIKGRRYMSCRLVNTALGCISFPGSLNQKINLHKY